MYNAQYVPICAQCDERCTCDGGEAAGRVVAQRVVDGERDILARVQVCEAAERVQEADVWRVAVAPAQHSTAQHAAAR
jgi:hypothetical protein